VRYEYVDVTDRADLVSPYPEVVGALERLGWRTLGRCATEFPPRVTERLLAGYAEPARSEFAAHVPDVATVQLSADGTTFAFVSWFWGSPPDAHRAHVAELAATPVPLTSVEDAVALSPRGAALLTSRTPRERLRIRAAVPRGGRERSDRHTVNGCER
jgi:hypothetical protein